MTDIQSHKPGCWYRNGGARCTCRSPKKSAFYADTAKKGDEKIMLEKIKNFDPLGGVQLEDAVVLATFARHFVAEYEALKLEVPTWLTDQAERIRQFVADTVRDSRKAKLAELKARRETYKSAAEKRDEIDKQIAALEAT